MRDNTLRRKQRDIARRRRQEAAKPNEQENPIKLSMILRILMMILFAGIFSGK